MRRCGIPPTRGSDDDDDDEEGGGDGEEAAGEPICRLVRWLFSQTVTFLIDSPVFNSPTFSVSMMLCIFVIQKYEYIMLQIVYV